MASQIRGYSVNEPEPKGPVWEVTENPQRYDQTAFAYVHKAPGRHMLGVVGGNEASLIKGNQVDLESDLRGLNIPNTFCPQRAYQPAPNKPEEIVRKNVKANLTINTQMQHLPTYQLWAYPAVLAPEPLRVDACSGPERF
jgi:hypothetical protein